MLDFEGYGHDLTKLKQHQVAPRERRVRDRSLSFGEVFEEACRGPTELLDPWRLIPSPERLRAPNEGDLFLNQVVPRSPNRVEQEEAEERRLKAHTRRLASNVSSAGSTTVPSRSSSKESSHRPVVRSRSLVLAGASSLGAS